MPSRPFPARLHVLGSIALLASAFAHPGHAEAREPEPFVLGLNGLPGPEHGGFFQAAVEGHYRQCGLDVRIVPGGPGIDRRTDLIAGTVDIHAGTNLLGAILAVEQGIDLTVAAAWFQKDPQALVTHPDSELLEWNDLLGAERYVLPEHVFRTYFRWLVADQGFDESRRVAPDDSDALLDDPGTVRQGYATSLPFEIERELGQPPNVFLFADNGLDGYAMTSEVMQRTLDERPDAVACFVEATAAGWRGYLHGDSHRASATIGEANPAVTEERIRFAIDVMNRRGIVEGGAAALDGIGSIRPERIRNFHDAMVDAGVVSDGLDVERVYTLDVVDGGAGLDARR